MVESRRDEPSGMSAPKPARRGPRPTTIGTVLRYTVAGLMVGAAAIHFGMMGEHAGVSWTHGLFFAVSAWAQVALAALIVFRPSRPVIALGIVGNLAILAIWVI